MHSPLAAVALEVLVLPKGILGIHLFLRALPPRLPAPLGFTGLSEPLGSQSAAALASVPSSAASKKRVESASTLGRWVLK